MDKPHSLPFIHLLMVICSVLVASSFTVGAAITAGLDPAVLTLLRFILATLLLWPCVRLRSPLSFSWSALWRCGIISASLVFFFWCMFLALRYTSALNTSVIYTLVPGISGAYAVLLVGERLGKRMLLALGLGLVGAVWVIFRGDPSLLLAMAWNKGDLIFLAGCFSMALYTPLVRLLHRGEPMLVMTFWIVFTGSCWLLLATGSRLFTVNWPEIPLMVWAGIVYLAIFTTVVTFFLTQYAVPFIGPTKAMAYSYLYPGLVLIIDLVLGHGWPGVSVLPGLSLVLLAMVLLQRDEKPCS
ncbi:MAG: DMT family transporter [Desulfocapsaceae bacterium]|nr:DMT family transporter [Desulfocapsaceae bacterium]